MILVQRGTFMKRKSTDIIICYDQTEEVEVHNVEILLQGPNEVIDSLSLDHR